MSSGSNRHCYLYGRITHTRPTVFWLQNSCPKFRVFVCIPTCPIPGLVAWEYSKIFKHRVSTVSPSVTVARVDIRTLFPDQLHMNYINTRLRSIAVDFTARSVKVCVWVNTSTCLRCSVRGRLINVAENVINGRWCRNNRIMWCNGKARIQCES